MSISILQIPYFITDFTNPVYYAYTDTFESENYNFKYYFDIYVNSVLVSTQETLEVQNVVKMNISDILSNYISSDFDIYTTGITHAENSYIKYNTIMKTTFDSNSAWTFSYDLYDGGYVAFYSPTSHTFSVGDIVYVDRRSVSYNNNYNGPQRIIALEDTDTIVSEKNYGIPSEPTPGNVYKLNKIIFTNIVSYLGYATTTGTTSNSLVAGDTVYIYRDGSSDSNLLGEKKIIAKIGNDLVLNYNYPISLDGKTGMCYQTNYQPVVHYSEDYANLLVNSRLDENEHLDLANIFSDYMPNLTTPCKFLSSDNTSKIIRSDDYDTVQFFNTDFDTIFGVNYFTLEKDGEFYYLENTNDYEDYILYAGSGPQNLLNTVWTTATTSALTFEQGDSYKIYLTNDIHVEEEYVRYPNWYNSGLTTTSGWTFDNQSYFNNPGILLSGGSAGPLPSQIAKCSFSAYFDSGLTYYFVFGFDLIVASNNPQYSIVMLVDDVYVKAFPLQFLAVKNDYKKQFTYTFTTAGIKKISFGVRHQTNEYVNLKFDYIYVNEQNFVTILDGSYKLSQEYNYTINNCKLYDSCKLYFLNKMGGYSYINCNYKSINTKQVDRKYFKRDLPYNYDKNSNSIIEYNRNESDIYILNTGYLSDMENEEFINMMNSDTFYLKINDKNNIIKEFPVILLSSKNTILKSWQKDRPQYTFEVQRSNQKNII